MMRRCGFLFFDDFLRTLCEVSAVSKGKVGHLRESTYQHIPPKKYVNIPSEKYIYVHKYVCICVYTYLCKAPVSCHLVIKMDAVLSHAILS